MKRIIDISEENLRLCPDYYQGDLVVSQILHAVKHGERLRKVYGVYTSYSNGEPDWCDEHYGFNTIMKIFISKEKALAYINSLKPEDMKGYTSILEGWEEVNASELARCIIRSFRRNIYSDIYESFEYSITEMEVE